MNEIEVIRRRLEREKKARQAAEVIAEEKTRAIFEANRGLQRLNERLEETVQRRTAEVIEARDQAIEANRAKSAFLASMSHELRTPLNAIIGYSEMLLEDAREHDSQAQFRDDLESIQSAGRHLLSLINDILDLSKIEARKMELYFEHFDVRGMIDEVVSTIGPLAEKNRNKLLIECAPDVGTMRSDLTKVRQSLFNLLSNAGKFTFDGEIELRVERTVDDGGEWLTFTIRDTGIGMSKDQLAKVFDAFAQADSSSTRHFGGTGLGLTITRNFCQLLNGEIDAESTPGEGSVFRMSLPAKPISAQPVADGERPVPAAADMPVPPTPEAGARTVLVIDDDPNARDILCRHLRSQGVHAQTADSGLDGLRAARDLKPDAILLDVLMPRMDGWTVLTALKTEPALAGIPVVMVSMLEDREIAFSLGAADYLTKPVDKIQLRAALDRHCPAPAHRRVLVMDDDPAVCDHLRHILEKDNWTVTVAENGTAGLACLAEAMPDVILLDLIMPEMDGFEVIGQLRRDARWRTVPVIVVTAKNLTTEDRLRLNGAVERLVKKTRGGLDDLPSMLRGILPADATQTEPNR